MSEWIFIRDKLPDNREYILISTDDAYLKQINPCFGWRDGKYWYAYTANGMYCINYPIAWMPLPDSYKAESEE